MSSREEMLARIRAATADLKGRPEVPRRYHQASRGPGLADDVLVGLFEERAGDYRATVRRCAAGEVARVIADAVADRGAKRIGVPNGFPAEWSALLTDAVGPPLDVAALDGLDGVVTTVAVAIAETGTIVLDTGPGQGSRAFSLVPDFHLAVVRTGQIVAAVPDAVAALDPARPLTWISGPSATSDIELSRVEGVHGPRTLDIVIVAELGPPAGRFVALFGRVPARWRLSRLTMRSRLISVEHPACVDDPGNWGCPEFSRKPDRPRKWCAGELRGWWSRQAGKESLV
jgi:L-lactate dehydrogenase complex protein LldG